MVPVGAPLVLLGLACAAAGPESARRRLGTSGGLTKAAAEQMAESGKFGQYHDWQSVTRADSKIMVIKDFKARLVSDAYHACFKQASAVSPGLQLVGVTKGLQQVADGMQYQFLMQVRQADGRVTESTCAITWRSWKDPAYHEDWFRDGNFLAKPGAPPAAAIPSPAASATVGAAGVANAQAQLAKLQKLKQLYLLKAKLAAKKHAAHSIAAPPVPAPVAIPAVASPAEKVQRMQRTKKRLTDMLKLKKELALLKLLKKKKQLRGGA